MGPELQELTVLLGAKLVHTRQQCLVAKVMKRKSGGIDAARGGIPERQDREHELWVGQQTWLQIPDPPLLAM